MNKDVAPGFFAAQKANEQAREYEFALTKKFGPKTVCTTPDQVFLDPEFKQSWRVMFNGKVCSPDFNDKGPALAYLTALKEGTRKPEYSS